MDKVPTWAYGAGAAVVVLALVARKSAGSSGATVTTVGPVANPNAAAELNARVSGFDQLTGFAGKLVDRSTQLAQINAQAATAQASAQSQQAVAEINAETERARIAAAAATATTQSADQLAATRTQAKASTTNGVISTIGKVVGSVFKVFGF